MLLIQIAKRCGAEVFTTVGSAAKAELATDAGADHVILYGDTDFGAAIEAIAGPRPLDVVYDGVGKAVFARSMELLRRRGTMVTFGNASGPVDPLAPLELSRGGSLYLTRPTLVDYIATREELERRADDLFAWIADGSLRVRIGARFPLAEAVEAHRRSRAATRRARPCSRRQRASTPEGVVDGRAHPAHGVIADLSDKRGDLVAWAMV